MSSSKRVSFLLGFIPKLINSKHIKDYVIRKGTVEKKSAPIHLHYSVDSHDACLLVEFYCSRNTMMHNLPACFHDGVILSHDERTFNTLQVPHSSTYLSAESQLELYDLKNGNLPWNILINTEQRDRLLIQNLWPVKGQISSF